MKLFNKLAKIYSGSGEEEPMRRFIKHWVKSSVWGAKITEDKHGNLYIVKGKSETYPCVVAHMDQVQDPYPEDYKVVETEDIIFGYSPSLKRQCGLGADDKCGIWIALKMLKKHRAIKVAFFPGEEVGCVGSSKADLEFFKDVRFVVEPDRKGASDLINRIGWSEICSKEFLNDIDCKAFGYKTHDGLMTDVEELKNRGLKVSCINLSCGYYDPHTEHEYVVKKDMMNALSLVNNIIVNCKKVYEHESSSYWEDYHYDWDWDKGYGHGWYGRGKRIKNEKSKRPTNHFEEDKKDDVDYDKWAEQYMAAEDWISLWIEDPDISPETFLFNYGSELPLLDIEDIRSIFAKYGWGEEGYIEDGYLLESDKSKEVSAEFEEK